MSDRIRWAGDSVLSQEPGWGRPETVGSSASSQGRDAALDALAEYRAGRGGKLQRKLGLILIAVPMVAWGQVPLPQASPHDIAGKSPTLWSVPLPQDAVNIGQSSQVAISEDAGSEDAGVSNSPAPGRTLASSDDGGNAKPDLDSCRVHEVKGLPGSHEFGSNFIEAIATDPDPGAKDSNVVWGLTADLSSKVPTHDRAMYISKSSNGGKTWILVARLDSKYFDAGIGEGERNGLSVSPGGTDFVITTQKGAFQVFPQSSTSDAVVRAIVGLRVPQSVPKVSIPKRKGEAVTAGVVKITADGKKMIVGYGYFDRSPQIFAYHRGNDGSWIKDGPLPHLPTDMDILSMQFGDANTSGPSFLYVGTGDQAYRLNTSTMKWSRIRGVGPDSAIQGISMVGGPHLAACWGVYYPLSADTVRRATSAKFLLHRAKDETGSNIRAFGVEVDPSRPNREVVTSLTGVYTSKDGGRSWNRLNDLPEGEFRSAHFNADGTLIVSGLVGTFLANPFSNACSLHLRTRGE